MFSSAANGPFLSSSSSGTVGTAVGAGVAVGAEVGRGTGTADGAAEIVGADDAVGATVPARFRALPWRGFVLFRAGV